MKKLISISLFVLCIAANAQTLKPFTIDGDISSLKEKADSIHISYSSNGKSYDDAFPVKNGHFVIKGNISQPVVALIYYFAPTDTIRMKFRSTDHTMDRIFIQPGKMSFKSGGTITENTLNGSPYNNDFKEMQAKNKALLDEWEKQFDLLELEKDSLIRHQKFPILMDSLRVAPKKIWMPYIDSHPHSPLVFYAIQDIMRFNHDIQGHHLAPIYEKMTAEMKDSYAGKRLKAIIKTGNGSIAPEFTQADTSGVQVSLSSFRGKYVLIDFWGSWCSFCRKENPNLIKNYEKYKDKGFAIIGVAADKEKDEWLGAIHKDGIGMWTHVSDLKGMKNEVSELYCISGYPSNFLVDPNGKIIDQNLRGEVLDKKLAEIFK